MNRNRQGGQVVIFNEDKSKTLLILREDFRIWVSPGGMMEEGETPAETAARGVFEETGYEVEIDYAVGQYHRPQFNNSLLHVFAGHVVGGDKNDDSWEVLAVEWFDVDNLPKRTFSLSREIIHDAQYAAQLPVMKTQVLPKWLALAFFVGVKVRNVRNWFWRR